VSERKLPIVVDLEGKHRGVCRNATNGEVGIQGWGSWKVEAGLVSGSDRWEAEGSAVNPAQPTRGCAGAWATDRPEEMPANQGPG
jgi:hypothetical protein